MAKKTEKKQTEAVVAEEVKATPSKKSKNVLAITLGGSLQAGTEISEEVLQELLDAGFTKERLFGKK